jgi:hypothetical protein
VGRNEEVDPIFYSEASFSFLQNQVVKTQTSLPFPLLDHLGAHQRILYRLVYISRGSDPIDAPNNVDPTTKVLKFEILIAGPPLDENENELEEASSGKEYLGDHTWDGIEHISDPQCWEGLRAEVGVMMPDR